MQPENLQKNNTSWCLNAAKAAWPIATGAEKGDQPGNLLYLDQTAQEKGRFPYPARVKTAGSQQSVPLTDIFYIIRKETHDAKRTYIIMENIFRLVAVLSVTEKDIQDAFGQKWKDFEDCVQYTTGKNNRIDYIITANHKDYVDAMLPVMTPAAWIKMV